MSALTASLPRLHALGLGAPLLLVMLLGMMMLPLPPLLLDALFTFNIALALIVILITVYAQRPLDFSVFPTVLLVATLLRLALNIASTRVVLLNGHTGTDAAGRVIEAFGEFVVGGNYAVGLVVFAILVIINFVVVTKGAGRVSEVTARFTLDAMPGKQMAIDADLSAGIISQEDARTRREEIRQEADFYGSMDGASKFVRGDAVAGILILLINIVGGLIIGMTQHDLDFSAAMRNYTLLTIGDGLVAQIPSLLLSTAAAIMVTRVTGSQDMGDQVMRQLFDDPRALAVAAGILFVLGLVPGMPHFVFLTLASAAAFGAYTIAQKSKAVALAEAEPDEPELQANDTLEVGWDDVAPVDVLGLEVGYRLISLVDRDQKGDLLERIRGVRKRLSQELGFLVPTVHIRDNIKLVPNSYVITLMGVTVGEGEVHPGKLMAIDPGEVFGQLDGMPTTDPAFGLNAYWIDDTAREEAETLGYTVVNASTVIATHLNQVMQDHAAELLGHDEVQQLLDLLAEHSPKLAEQLVPESISLSGLLRVLQNLLAEKIPIRDLRTIAETITELGQAGADRDQITAAVRTALGRMIVQNIYGNDANLDVITLDPELERLLAQAKKQSSADGVPTIEPGMMESLQRSMREAAERQEVAGKPTVLVVSSAIRSLLARFFRMSRQFIHVLAYEEIPDNKQITVVSTIGRGTA
jgi:flagellar biosynthesis protein FlhA